MQLHIKHTPSVWKAKFMPIVSMSFYSGLCPLAWLVLDASLVSSGPSDLPSLAALLISTCQCSIKLEDPERMSLPHEAVSHQLERKCPWASSVAFTLGLQLLMYSLSPPCYSKLQVPQTSLCN